jgi:hypothetical protein
MEPRKENPARSRLIHLAGRDSAEREVIAEVTVASPATNSMPPLASPYFYRGVS